MGSSDVAPPGAPPGGSGEAVTPTAPAWTAGPAADGRRRRRWAIAVVAIAAASAIGGAVVGSRLQSPADAANERDAPPASRITVGVESRTLSSTLTLAGDISFAQPTEITLAGSVAIAEGETAVVTRVPALDAAVVEGDALLEVSGRPVIVLQGALPMYRSIGPGARGSDVNQLESALARLGFDPGPIDDVYDAATEAAVDAFYASRGMTSAGPSAADDARLQDLRDRVTEADKSLRAARDALAAAGEGTTGSALLTSQQAYARAQAGVPAAQADAARSDAESRGAVVSAQAASDAAIVARDGAAALYSAAVQPGAIDPDTGEPFTASAIALLRDDSQAKRAAAISAAAAVDDAVRSADATAEAGQAAVQAARDALALATVELAEAQEPPDTSSAQEGVDAAAVELVRATQDLAAGEAEIGTRVPAGEVVFVASLPLTVTNVAVAPGAAATGVLATVSSGATEVTGRVSSVDADLVTVGAPVVIEIRDTDEQFEGTVSYVGPPRQVASTQADVDDGSGSFGQPASDDEGASSRLEVVVTPADPAAVELYEGASVRLRIDVGSTNGDVLVVPVSAVTVGGDGTSRVEVEVEPVTEAGEGVTEIVEVEVGLTAQGYVEVRPVGGDLQAGDRVVVGVDDPSAVDDRTDTDDTGDTGDTGDDQLAPLGTDGS
ncbi:MAG: peptidoglycan-binding protein [Ilumatobacteraceae bacterium]